MPKTGPFWRRALTGLWIALCLVIYAAAPAEACEPDCALADTVLFELAAPGGVQVFTISINPFLVSGRISARGGTGFPFDGGYVATNYHVVADADMLVIFEDGAVHDVEIIGIDPSADVAVLHPIPPLMETEGLAFAPFDPVTIGQQAIAIGFPLGLGKSMSKGIISDVSRVLPITTSSWMAPYLQTDAAISHGNSGGPLLVSCGRVIGMATTAIIREGAENLGFSIPIPALAPILQSSSRPGRCRGRGTGFTARSCPLRSS
ncbi:trypsin-like peptidase domain-containing protein [Aestuariicoccus sp. KMU-90]|uniref:Trypsin-like peptidase domain-containing protein n=2 Tax=Thetidibacter halocola TaxID=2827239 RepID=A0A8J7WIF8_9RHOB|nr:trypsin-like peptidase domain-containing protein [Thetidibacter halocola]